MESLSFLSSLLSFRLKAPERRHNPTITFLDVDGVLNNSQSDITQLFVVEGECMRLLKHLVEVTQTDIVLSSTWRQQEKSKQILQSLFKEASIPLWIDTTPHLDNRVDEILCWLLENTTFPFKADIKIEEHEIQKDLPKREITQYIILDDMDLSKCGSNSELLKDHVIRTSVATGLTKEDTERAIKLLRTG